MNTLIAVPRFYTQVLILLYTAMFISLSEVYDILPTKNLSWQGSSGTRLLNWYLREQNS